MSSQVISGRHHSKCKHAYSVANSPEIKNKSNPQLKRKQISRTKVKKWHWSRLKMQYRKIKCFWRLVALKCNLLQWSRTFALGQWPRNRRGVLREAWRIAWKEACWTMILTYLARIKIKKHNRCESSPQKQSFGRRSISPWKLVKMISQQLESIR